MKNCMLLEKSLELEFMKVTDCNVNEQKLTALLYTSSKQTTGKSNILSNSICNNVNKPPTARGKSNQRRSSILESIKHCLKKLKI